MPEEDDLNERYDLLSDRIHFKRKKERNKQIKSTCVNKTRRTRREMRFSFLYISAI